MKNQTKNPSNRCRNAGLRDFSICPVRLKYQDKEKFEIFLNAEKLYTIYFTFPAVGF